MSISMVGRDLFQCNLTRIAYHLLTRKSLKALINDEQEILLAKAEYQI